MNTSIWCSIILWPLLSWPLSGFAQTDDSQKLLSTIKTFYGWVLENSNEISSLEPKIKDIAGTTHFFLDTSSLKMFIEKFMSSQHFAPEFQAAIERYYIKHKQEFEALTQKDFDDYASAGRGPLMDVENMDIYFCAQEYEYTPEFIEGLKIIKSTVNDASATAVVESSYKWQTTFHFSKVNGQWLISGYCVYE